MKILTISDEEYSGFYEYYTPGVFAEFDLILACGDLKKQYLEFIVTMASCPVLYVCGNHDESFRDGLNYYTEKEMKKCFNHLKFRL